MYPLPLRVMLLAGLEFSFLTFPATPFSSAVLQIVHLAVLLQIQPPTIIWEELDTQKRINDKKQS